MQDRKALPSRPELKAAARRRSMENYIARWQERTHGQVNFYLSQVLSGHGCFRQYLKRFGHETEDWCPECGSDIVEDAEHVLFECRRFGFQRQELEEVAGSSISAESLVPRMLEDQRVWEAANSFRENNFCNSKCGETFCDSKGQTIE
ncbi:uncharacterized protein [Drosophila kikkawai]|uniref:Reverse transcriptase n=1 Tax=Drosophila kikkawai TaxID=30033 RepID=A0ABM3C758_DROKI|nr:uncharacterized protein LOC121502778 [Drosophila kikkawai]